MIILIDAYNLLKQHFGQDISDKEQEEYLNKLKKYAQKKKHTILMIFDGGSFDVPMREKDGSVGIVYAGKNKSADDLIKQYLDLYKTKELLLVSSDRELVNYANNNDFVTIDSITFDHYLNNFLKKPFEQTQVARNKIKKMHPEKYTPKLDKLMHEASVMIPIKTEEEISSENLNQRKQRKLSKKERKIMMILKKL